MEAVSTMTNKSESILIFGATGTIGAYSALYFKEKGYQVIVSGKRSTDNGFFKENDIDYYPIDISKKSDFSALKKVKPQVILHCAGIMPAAMNGYYPQNYITSILIGTLNILDFAIQTDAEKILFTHSHADSSYLAGTDKLIPSDIEKKFPLTGDHSIYSICKNASVDLIEHYYHQHGLKRFTFRLPTIYAYHPNPFFYVNGERIYIAYRYIINQAIRGEKIEIWGNPQRKKEIVYIKDLCQLFEQATKSKLDGGLYNVGRGLGVTLDEQIKGIIDVFCPKNRVSKLVYRPDKPDAKQFVHDISKIKNELGFKSNFNYMELLRDFKEEMHSQRFLRLWGSEKDYPND